ncbi:helix-turn-helix transcriptional regulator [Listeria monocytogenes]|uniref:helix-turn-helix domain-containing protein n=1 Tax=Listeria monocytogenes TaxID=1639 RepID=UPI0010BBF8EC|nr:helix-turn-helix transcriptional regulator [Listeria monocytogenes]EAC3456885.1 XRE family transcriptional regulator [Listeria monocytogenes]EAC4365843.1 XRE family transcriptional regulator [Listeria monocytogenes]EAC4831133.1 XRE family transcriptional regulator [Listeria monocytogenes]EAC6175416.1 XRE family transcriptional regulator [Listeria monocytogenes]EAC9834108.1 XRE family transcriptional regulator [Listeria monocytogenes]
MEVGAQIKKYRSNMGISQEELAEKIYVSRQTVSNWETGKNYPDIHSVLRLSLLFNTSLDQLIKGDIEIMKIEIKEIEIRKINKISYMYAFLLILTLISFVPFIALMGWYGLIPWVILYAITIYVALKAEKVKKANNLSTYREIVAFMEGKQLDEVEKQQEIGKRPYQKVLYMFGSAAMALIIFYLMTKIFLL